MLGNRYVRLLEQVVENVALPIQDIDFFLPGERHQVLYDFNCNANVSKHTPKHLLDVFHAKVGAFPNRLAVFDTDSSETYQSLNDQSERLAALIVQNLNSDHRVVGVMLPRSIELVRVILAIIKAGCAYVAIDPGYPTKRKAYIVNDAKMTLLITMRSLLSGDVFNCNTLLIEEIAYSTDHYREPSIYDPNDLAYIAYTSGSTGAPKGVMVEHHSVVKTLENFELCYPVAKGDVYLLKTNAVFDISVTELFGWFFGEGALYVLPHLGEQDPRSLLQAIMQYRITHINFVPSMFRVFLQVASELQHKAHLKTLKWIFLGGERFDIDILTQFNALNLTAKLENMYGPTECSMWATHCSTDDLKLQASVPVGKPFEGVHCYVVNQANQLLPIGQPGELCIAGIGVARGYLYQDQLTQEKFVENPFLAPPQHDISLRRMYRTGDLVRWLSNGQLEYLGRMDTQIKLRGVRIELTEIEVALKTYPAVIDAIVDVKGGSEDALLCAYYCAQQEITQAELKMLGAEGSPCNKDLVLRIGWD